MINRKELLKDLQRLLPQLEADLRERCDVPEIGAAVKAEYDKAKEAERTAQSFEDWRSDYITQIGAAWILSCVFSRFLEDNQLVDPPKLSGPGEHLQRARDEYDLYVHDHPADTVREYLLSVFDGLEKLPGADNVFGGHNPIHQQRSWLGGDAAKELRNFWQRIDPETGNLVHDFTERNWDTRFLGDLYQDLSEAARKKYALLQTPDFVEEFILDRTLEPALNEFGLKPSRAPREDGTSSECMGFFKMIDPACGSGHFLLGAFPRILARWQKQEPGTNVRELVQRTLDSIHGVDINPFAIAIARFRLLLAALQASDVRRLVDAPAFHMNLACGDSLYHGRQRQQVLGDWTDESHYFRTEDAKNLRRFLQEGTFHAVVANPPYITVKDKAANQAYRRLYSSCHRQYSLAVPFMERVFRLCINSSDAAGYNGQITGNNFMKREFGKCLIENFFRTVDLTHVIDSQLAHIPGHGIPTVIIFGRNRPQVAPTVRLVGAIKREDGEPVDPANGAVWRSIVDHIDEPNFTGDYVSVSDASCATFYEHPWSIGGGGAAALKTTLDEQSSNILHDFASAGISVLTGEDNCLVLPKEGHSAKRFSVPAKDLVIGDGVRDWTGVASEDVLWPNDDTGQRMLREQLCSHIRFLWPYRPTLKSRKLFSVPVEQKGVPWWALKEVYLDKFKSLKSIVFCEVSTHNHFAFDITGMAFKQTAPVIKLRDESGSLNHADFLGVLNSSVACFWLKQVCHCKGGGGIGGGIAAEAWERFYAINGTKVQQFPLPDAFPRELSSKMMQHVNWHLAESPSSIVQKASRYESNCRTAIEASTITNAEAQRAMIRLQEDLDWECYRLYGLLEEGLTYPGCPSQVVRGPEENTDDGELKTENSFGIQLGERAFEIVLARKMARGEVQTTWFERHRSTPITELPDHWPDDYRRLVQRRIEVIESDPQIALIEQPEYKRRWNTERWESQVERALRSWLLDRLENYFDFDGRMNDEGRATAHASLIEPRVISTAQLADIARLDRQFMEFGEVYRDRKDFDVTQLVTDLVAHQSVPLLSVLRYKPAAMDKRLAWERTWDLQRQEDAIDARVELEGDEGLTEDQAAARKKNQIGDIPVPPKYKSSDFQSSTYWRLRGKLDVPKERWVSFPHCEGEDQSLVIAWAGYDHLQLTKGISALFAEVQEKGGSEDPRLVPLLGCILELNPWVKQWHNDVDPDFGYRLGDYFANFVEDEARTLGKTIDDIKAWQPPAKTKRRKKKK
jgi:hypothetical protein